jgi:hypothetical protein
VISKASQVRARSGSARSETLLIHDLEFAVCRILTALVIVIHRDIINVNSGNITLVVSIAEEADSKSLVIIFSSNAKLLLIVLPGLDGFFSISVNPTTGLAPRASACANSALIGSKWAAFRKLEVVCENILSTSNDTLKGLQE